MGYMDYEQLVVTATTSGVATANTVKSWRGKLYGVQFVASTSAPYSTQMNVVLSGERNGSTFLDLDNASAGLRLPRQFTVTSTGSTGLGTPVPQPFPLFEERISFTITSGSTSGTKTGTWRLYVEADR